MSHFTFKINYPFSSIMTLILFSFPFWSFYLLVGLEGREFQIFLLIISAVMFLYVLTATYNHKYVLLALLFIFLNVFQNTIFGLSFNINPTKNDNLLLFLGVKDILIAFIIISLILCDKDFIKCLTIKLKKHEIFILIWFLVIFISFFLSSGLFMAKLSYVRNFCFGFLLYFFGKLVIKNKDALTIFLKFVVGMAILVCLFAFLEFLFFDKFVYLDVFHLDKIYQAKHGHPSPTDVELLPSGREVRYGTDIMGVPFSRIGSTFFEPVNLSYFLAFSWVILLFLFYRNKNLLSAFLVISSGLILSFGKGGWIVAFFSFIGLVLFTNKIIVKLRHLLLINLLYVVIIILFGYKISYSAAMHIIALGYGFKSMLTNLLGFGLGSGGNFENIFSHRDITDYLLSGADSTFGVIMFQLGGIGILFWILAHLFLIKQLLRARNYYHDISKKFSRLNLAAALMITTIFINGLFQEHTSGTQAAGIYYLFSGMMTGLYYRDKRQRNENIN